jgi:hypothetical protein
MDAVDSGAAAVTRQGWRKSADIEIRQTIHVSRIPDARNNFA